MMFASLYGQITLHIFIHWMFVKHAVSTILYFNNFQKRSKHDGNTLSWVATHFLWVTHPFLWVTQFQDISWSTFWHMLICPSEGSIIQAIYKHCRHLVFSHLTASRYLFNFAERIPALNLDIDCILRTSSLRWNQIRW